ncbi:MAG: HAD hydrolase family protein [Butyrivibrio sp.]|jgi:3-deoxy-D-manno-octulosonate 8-phosphate phosphatase (KDO 8-P phosphatase)|nr:HAD hydrolase family protein [Butyrivibrio sp.]
MNKINYLIMDVDGTLTDGKIYIGNEGEIFKVFSIKDGYGIHNILPQEKIIPIVITGRASDILKIRCNELGIKNIYQGAVHKIENLEMCRRNLGLNLKEVAYIGDDLNDFECMQVVKRAGGVVGCPQDAVKAIQDSADFISAFSGGNGAVRDFIEWISEYNTRCIDEV